MPPNRGNTRRAVVPPAPPRRSKRTQYWSNLEADNWTTTHSSVRKRNEAVGPVTYGTCPICFETGKVLLRTHKPSRKGELLHSICYRCYLRISSDAFKHEDGPVLPSCPICRKRMDLHAWIRVSNNLKAAEYRGRTGSEPPHGFNLPTPPFR